MKTETPKEKLKRLDRKIDMIFFPLFIGFAILVASTAGCKKDTPPALPKINRYRMEIQITDNSPFKNVGSLFAIGNANFYDDQKIGSWTDQEFIYADNQPVYVQRTLEYCDYDTAAAYLWIGTNLVYDNWYNVEMYRNDSLIYQNAGYVLDAKIQTNK